jgi:hypothetical protein
MENRLPEGLALQVNFLTNDSASRGSASGDLASHGSASRDSASQLIKGVQLHLQFTFNASTSRATTRFSQESAPLAFFPGVHLSKQLFLIINSSSIFNMCAHTVCDVGAEFDGV